MEQVKPHTLSGFMELLPQPQVQMEAIMRLLRETYARYGYTPLDTPLIEASDVLLAKGGGETEKQIYRFMRGDNDIALRFDLTVPLAKYVALHYGALAFPFKRYQIGKVYRGERAQRGRFREFYQADVDMIGDGALSLSAEAEMVDIIYRAFTGLGLKRFRVRINNRKLLSGFYASLSLSEKSGDILRTVDKIDKIGGEKVKALLIKDCAVTAEQADAILSFLSTNGSTDELLSTLSARFGGTNALFDEGLNDLRQVVAYIRAHRVPDDFFCIDLSIARGLDYYTGTVYETALLDHPEIGSICSGGRYDNLAEYYINKKLPGVGISIGLTRLFYVLQEQGYLNRELPTAPADALLIPMTEDITDAVSLAETLRDAGVRVQLYTEEKKFKAKMAYANKLQFPYVILLGEDELAQNAASLKDMKTGEQQLVDYERLAAILREKRSRAESIPPISD